MPLLLVLPLPSIAYTVRLYVVEAVSPLSVICPLAAVPEDTSRILSSNFLGELVSTTLYLVASVEVTLSTISDDVLLARVADVIASTGPQVPLQSIEGI